ncbi:GDP-mannose pyrophosphatase NudK [Autumnicola musiva]|uniref:GDP-mannose pyrophosphatase n=1 Tax=Autumnicola musiva TaxID=3075589 RepID=A0ABU3D3F6_9FLAO|nr:GDP-mannose pyrophosphatase NudK [Zunongwangia sp. F117]MDT0676063.1 GDP-mannose pyrophosphatase NudK [Zunongwangia sp. F117]
MSRKIKLKKTEVLSNRWALLNEITYEYQTRRGEWQTQNREAYDRGDGACILLYNRTTKKVILTRQFRLPTYLNNNPGGMMIEACAGLLDKDYPEACIIKETEEETGYRIPKARKIFESYMSPGSVTELIHFFVGEYSEEMKVSEGGGLAEEQEDIEVLEMDFEEAYNKIANGEIKDGKTIILLQYMKINDLINK